MHRLSLCLLVMPLVSLPGQQIPQLTLAPANGALTAEFTRLTWARELTNGRVILTDLGDGRLVVADMRSGAIEAIGRKGQGPGEYTTPQPVWSIGGDSSLMMDGARRWLLFVGPRVVATLPPESPAIVAAKGIVRGVDAQGYVFSVARAPAQAGTVADSALLLRVTRAAAHVDTLGKIKVVAPRQVAGGRDGTFAFAMPTLGTPEEMVPFPDGSVAVVRLNPYRVDWRMPTGAWTRGAPLPVPAVPMDAHEKEAYLRRIAQTTNTPVRSSASITDWPATVPPYESPVRILASPDGRVVISRMPTADHPETRYDIVNRRGVLDGQLAMRPNESIVGFGSASVYIAVTDVDGIQRLRRHPWPVLPAR
jgi:hypothetical protein